ncbi:MAG: hypothetical protein L3K26_04070 [Candidatus Hydrogenedentes bacterium]|nr:hypothetical protein [Candidatus Hydrogenedentota bacterium]
MATRLALPRITRRGWMQSGLAGLAGVGLARGTLAETPSKESETVRDRLWIFTCAANSDYPHMGRRSVMTPAEGAFCLGVPNIFMVQSSESEAPYGRLEPPLAQYMVALRPLKRVVWSVVGSGGFYSPKETEEVLKIAETAPNFTGIMLDDFFTGEKEGHRAKLTIEELGGIRSRLKRVNENFDIFATVYGRQLDLPILDYLAMIDVVTLWTSNSEDLANLESNLKKVDAVAPHAKKLLGCYFVDYGKKQGVPVSWMKHQCETGLRWLQEGKIEGMIFLGNTTMDLGFESVNWTRQWIEEVGDRKL